MKKQFNQSAFVRLLAVIFAFALVAAACGSDSSDTSTDAASDDTSSEESTDDAMEEESSDDDAMEEESSGDDAMEEDDAMDEAVCPTNLVIQTDWWPELEHGGSYQLIGPGGEASQDNFSYSGPIQPQYAVGGIETVEVRAGGDAISFTPALNEMAAQDDIFLAYVNTSDVIASWPTIEAVGVAATLEINPQMLMWDPAQNDFSDPATIGASGVTVLHFDGTAYIDWLIGQGTISADQTDPSYGGAPDRWLTSEGSIVQQGFATNEVYKYENDIEGWQQDVEFVLIHDLGFEDYPAMYTVEKSLLDEKAPCLEVLVPVLQQAWVDYWADPIPVTDELISINETFDTYWTLSEGLNTEGVAIAESTGIAGNGPDSTYGNFDMDRVQGLLDATLAIFQERGIDVPDDLSASDIVTNDFIDDSVGR